MMLLIPRLPVPLPGVLEPERVAIDSPDLDVERARQLAGERRPGALGGFDEGVVGGADLDLVGVEDGDGEPVVARVGAGALVQLVLDDVHAAPAGRVAGGDVLGW